MISDELLIELLAFRKERDWEQFHNLRTLSKSIALEAAELMEHTQWAKDGDLPTLATVHRDALAEEMGDIAILLTYLTHDLRIDLETAMRQKLVKNAAKYPVEKAKGCRRSMIDCTTCKSITIWTVHWNTHLDIASRLSLTEHALV